jgi:GH15 family glucan-1,4-alpha-glucosidase
MRKKKIIQFEVSYVKAIPFDRPYVVWWRDGVNHYVKPGLIISGVNHEAKNYFTFLSRLKSPMWAYRCVKRKS